MYHHPASPHRPRPTAFPILRPTRARNLPTQTHRTPAPCVTLGASPDPFRESEGPEEQTAPDLDRTPNVDNSSPSCSSRILETPCTVTTRALVSIVYLVMWK